MSDAKQHMTDWYKSGTESEPEDEWGDPYCGTFSEEPKLTNDWEYVDCKRCIKLFNKRAAHRKGEEGEG